MLGSLTGLIPGFHVNNVALILLALSPALLELGIPLASVAAIIVSTGTVHTFLNYIPSALIGAPDGDTALSLLPGHRMLLSGNAARGVAWSARGSQLGLFLSSPHRPGTHRLWTRAGLVRQPALSASFVLLTISFLLLATETTRLDWPNGYRSSAADALAGIHGLRVSSLQRPFSCWLDFTAGVCLRCLHARPSACQTPACSCRASLDCSASPTSWTFTPRPHTFLRNEKIGPYHRHDRSWCRVSGQVLQERRWAYFLA